MELVLVITFAGLIGAAIRYMVPGRDRHGLGLMPSVGVIVGSLSYVIAVWAGLAPRSVWPWLISLGLTVIACVWLGIWLPKKRDADDAALFTRLTDTKAQSKSEPGPDATLAPTTTP
jgi:type II secretory pathway component PulM